MVIKLFKISTILLLMIVTTGCPKCGKSEWEPISNSVSIEPMKDEYHIGESLMFSIVIPSNEVSEKVRGVDTAELDTYPDGFYYLLKNNEYKAIVGSIEKIEGRKVPFGTLIYDETTKNYILKIEITFTTVGNYILDKSSYKVRFEKDRNNCETWTAYTHFKDSFSTNNVIVNVVE